MNEIAESLNKTIVKYNPNVWYAVTSCKDIAELCHMLFQKGINNI